MNYRQWKKNYKKRYGINPPLDADKRKQRKQAAKVLRTINSVDWYEVCNTVSANIVDAVAIVAVAIAEGFKRMSELLMSTADAMRQEK